MNFLLKHWRAGLVIGLLAFSSVSYYRLDSSYSAYKEQIAKQELEESKENQRLKQRIEVLNHEADKRLTEQYEKVAQQSSIIDELESGNLRLRRNLATTTTTLEELTSTSRSGNDREGCRLSPDLIEFLDSEYKRADRVVLQLQAAQDVIKSYRSQ